MGADEPRMPTQGMVRSVPYKGLDQDKENREEVMGPDRRCSKVATRFVCDLSEVVGRRCCGQNDVHVRF
jgi:hypothetical protein